MNYIKDKIRESGYTCIHVAQEVGISTTELSNYIAEVRKPNHTRLMKLKDTLKCKITDLYPNAKRIVYWDLFGAEGRQVGAVKSHYRKKIEKKRLNHEEFDLYLWKEESTRKKAEKLKNYLKKKRNK